MAQELKTHTPTPSITPTPPPRMTYEEFLEYWMLDQTRKRAEFYHLGDDGTFKLIDADENGVYRARLSQTYGSKLTGSGKTHCRH
jgi:hypothetical protein